MNIEILVMTEDLVEDVYNIEFQSFSSPWSRKSFEEELKNPCAVYFVATADGIGVAYIGMWEISGQCDITNLAVIPQYRRKGVASMLIQHLIRHCKQNNLSPITLEVRESNIPARSLYQSLGFTVVGFRKKYYSDTGEDALIMSLII